MKRLILVSTCLLLAISACAPSPDAPTGSDDMDIPVSSDETPTSSNDPAPQRTEPLLPSPADSALERGNVYIDATELLVMESFPLQFSLLIQGSLPTPCHQLRVTTAPPDADNRILVDVYSVSDPAAICAQMLQPFDQNIPLGSFPAGKYTLWVNGKQVAEFDG